MLNRIMTGAFVAAGLCFLLVTGVRGQSSYRVSVSLDETTRGDMDVVGTSLEKAAAGSEVPRSVRRLATSAAGELALLADQRVSAGNLTLDDGTIVALMPDDEVSVSVAGEAQAQYITAQGELRTAPKKTVVIVRACEGNHCSMKPAAIIVVGGGQCRRALFFSHPPTVLAC